MPVVNTYKPVTMGSTLLQPGNNGDWMPSGAPKAQDHVLGFELAAFGYKTHSFPPVKRTHHGQIVLFCCKSNGRSGLHLSTLKFQSFIVNFYSILVLEPLWKEKYKLKWLKLHWEREYSFELPVFW